MKITDQAEQELKREQTLIKASVRNFKLDHELVDRGHNAGPSPARLMRVFRAATAPGGSTWMDPE